MAKNEDIKNGVIFPAGDKNVAYQDFDEPLRNF